MITEWQGRSERTRCPATCDCCSEVAAAAAPRHSPRPEDPDPTDLRPDATATAQTRVITSFPTTKFPPLNLSLRNALKNLST